MNFTGGDLPEQLRSGQVSADYFRLFGAHPQLGRTFTAGGGSAERPKVVVVSRGLWSGGSTAIRNIIGKTDLAQRRPLHVIGILGRLRLQRVRAAAGVWVPFQLDPNTNDQGHYFQARAG